MFIVDQIVKNKHIECTELQGKIKGSSLKVVLPQWECLSVLLHTQQWQRLFEFFELRAPAKLTSWAQSHKKWSSIMSNRKTLITPVASAN